MTASTSAPIAVAAKPIRGPHTQSVVGMPGMAGVFAGIKGGFKLKSAGQKGSPPDSPPQQRVNLASHLASRAPLAPITSLLHGANDSRKDVSLMASKKMKQLQWEKVSKAQLGKTVWGETEHTEVELIGKMQAVNLWSEMEDEFKAKEIIRDAVSE